jgi:hypothetical protein
MVAPRRRAGRPQLRAIEFRYTTGRSPEEARRYRRRDDSRVTRRRRQGSAIWETTMSKSGKYLGYEALDPFFGVIQ